MKPLSFVLICDTYPPVVGGSEVEAQRVCSAMIARGHQARVLCAGGPPMPELRDWIDPAGVPTHILTRTSRGRIKDLVFALRVAWWLWRERNNYQLVYFLMQGLHLAAGLPVARLLGKPIVMKFGGSGVIPLMRRSRAGRVELGWLNRWASRLMVLNQGMVDEAIADGFRHEQLYWMPNPTDTNAFRPPVDAEEQARVRAGLGLAADARIILYVGRLAPEKGLHWLIEAFATVAQTNPKFQLVLCGDGPQRAALTAQAAALAIPAEQLLFAGSRPVAEVATWCRAADVFALTSPSEGFSCALAEAMASGLPAVVSDIPANAQLIHHQSSGFMVPTGDTAAIADALNRLLSDGPLRAAYGEAARRHILDNYSLDQVIVLYENLFAEIIAKSESAGSRK